MPMNLKQLAGIGIVAVLLLLAISYGIQGYTSTLPGKYDGLAACLADKGVMFYGAFWCPHCKDQKKLFGNSAKLLPYTECSTPDGQGQLQVCKDKNIQGYPTWIFADGTVKNEILTPESLATAVGCPLEEGVSTDTPQETGTTTDSAQSLDLQIDTSASTSGSVIDIGTLE